MPLHLPACEVGSEFVLQRAVGEMGFVELGATPPAGQEKAKIPAPRFKRGIGMDLALRGSKTREAAQGNGHNTRGELGGDTLEGRVKSWR